MLFLKGSDTDPVHMDYETEIIHFGSGPACFSRP